MAKIKCIKRRVHSKLPKDWAIKFVSMDIWRVIFNISALIVNDHTFKALLRLSHVCSTWRNVVLNAPELWSKIEFKVHWGGNPLINVSLLDHALLHAQGCPLTITIFEAETYHPSVVFPYLENVHRAKRLELGPDFLDLFSEKTEAFQAVQAKWQGSKPLLEELVFFPTEQLPQAITNIWTPSPNLHTLIIENDYDDEISWMLILNDLCFPYQQLTSLKVEFSTAVDFLAVLAEAHNLIRCDIVAVTSEIPLDSAPTKLLLLEALQDLKLSGLGGKRHPPLTRLLSYINTPILTSLSLRNDYDWSSLSFTSFIHQSSCHIRDLTIDHDIPKEESIQSLGLLSSLQILRVTQSTDYFKGDSFLDVFANALKGLTPSKTEFYLFPDLKTIEINCASLTREDVSDTPFADMIEARFRLFPTNNSFERVVVLGAADDGIRSSELIRLLILKRDGLNIVFDPVVPVLQSVICRGNTHKRI